MASIAAARIRSGESPPTPLFWRVAITNAAIFSVGVALLALTPATVSFPVSLEEAVVLAAGAMLVTAGNMLALRRAFAPLARLTRHMATVDPLLPGAAALEPAGGREIAALTRAFNEMSERLELERRESVRRAVRAQEAERLRIAQELHDDIGQSLTFLLIQLSHANRTTDGGGELAAAQEIAREVLEDARSIAERLRPESLDDLGLVMALETLAGRVSASGGIGVATHLDGDLPQLSADVQLVIYRVAQEALTNALRHANAATVLLSLQQEGPRVVLRVRDDGRGCDDPRSRRGGGIRGMRERALSVGGSLAVDVRPSGGTCVTLDVEPEPAT